MHHFRGKQSTFVYIPLCILTFSSFRKKKLYSSTETKFENVFRLNCEEIWKYWIFWPVLYSILISFSICLLCLVFGWLKYLHFIFEYPLSKLWMKSTTVTPNRWLEYENDVSRLFWAKKKHAKILLAIGME